MKQESILDRIFKFFQSKTIFTNLILVNVLVFLSLVILKVILKIFLLDDFLIKDTPTLVWNYLSSTSDLPALLRRPWSLISYMFVHVGFIHILGNMVTFYFFGRYLDQFLGSRKLLSTYILGGLAGWALYAIGYNFIPMFKAMGHGPMWGASAAVIATVVAAATYRPNMKINLIFVQLEFKYLAGLIVLMDFLALDTGVNAGGHLGHLGGALYGFFMIRQLQKGKDMNAWLERLLDRLKNLFRRSPNMKVVYKKSQAAQQSDEEYNYTKAQAQKKIDKILDKISMGGYDSLTKAEKEFLNKFGTN